MSEKFVEIVKYGDPEEVVERLGPMSERKADRLDGDLNINLKHEQYYTRIVDA
jgi:hypothetical protein